MNKSVEKIERNIKILTSDGQFIYLFLGYLEHHSMHHAYWIALHVAAKLREYSSITVSRVQSEINRILFAADLGYYEKPSKIALIPHDSRSSTPHSHESQPPTPQMYTTQPPIPQSYAPQPPTPQMYTTQPPTPQSYAPQPPAPYSYVHKPATLTGHVHGPQAQEQLRISQQQNLKQSKL